MYASCIFVQIVIYVKIIIFNRRDNLILSYDCALLINKILNT